MAERVARDAVLFLCLPGPLLVIGAHLPMIKAWDFRPKAMGFVLVNLRWENLRLHAIQQRPNIEP